MKENFSQHFSAIFFHFLIAASSKRANGIQILIFYIIYVRWNETGASYKRFYPRDIYEESVEFLFTIALISETLAGEKNTFNAIRVYDWNFINLIRVVFHG